MLTVLNISDSNIDFESMTCFHPLIATRLFSDALQKHVISFDDRDLGQGQTLYLPCGQCIGCRIARSREWAARCVHEASLYDKNCFITLTYDDEHLPADGSLCVKDFQDFMKRLRFKFKGHKIRFLHCGEYGTLNKRPHFHALLFGFDFPDKKLWSLTPRGDKVYRSPILEELWTDGFSTIGAVTFESCAYVARYVTKKVTGELAEEHYQGKAPEYITMSRRPGIGSEWFKKYHSDVFPNDFVVLKDGRKIATPRYYMKQLEKFFPEQFDDVQSKRLDRQNSNPQYQQLNYFSDLEELYKQFHEWEKQSKCVSHRINKKLKRRFENGTSSSPHKKLQSKTKKQNS